MFRSYRIIFLIQDVWNSPSYHFRIDILHTITRVICITYGVIPTIGKHVIAEDALAGGGKGVGIEESACCGVVIAGLAVVQLGVGIVDVAAVAEGVLDTEGTCHGSGDTQNVTPGVVGVLNNGSTGGIQDGSHIALKVHHEVVHLCFCRSSRDIGDFDRLPGCVQNEVQLGAVVVVRRVADGSLVPAMESEDSMAFVVL